MGKLKQKGGKIYGEGSFGIVGDVDDFCSYNMKINDNNAEMPQIMVEDLKKEYVLKVFREDSKYPNANLEEEFDKNEVVRKLFENNTQATLLHRTIKKLSCYCNGCRHGTVQTAIPYKKFDGSIRDILNSRSMKLTFYDVVRLVNDSCKFLQVLAKKNYHHFDIKPENILYKRDEKGELSFILADYGSISTERYIHTPKFVPYSIDILKNELKILFSHLSASHWVDQDIMQNTTFNNWIIQKGDDSLYWESGIWNDVYALAMTMYFCIPLISDDRHRIWARNLFKQMFIIKNFDEILSFCRDTDKQHRDLEYAEQVSKNEDIVKLKEELRKINDYRLKENAQAVDRLNAIIVKKKLRIRNTAKKC